MLKAVSTEIMKMRKNKIFLVCSLIAAFSAVMMVVKDWLMVPAPENYSMWIMGNYTVTALILPIMSGFVLTFLFQREYEDKTIINVLTAPTSRRVFLFSKLLAWFLWYAMVLFIIIIIYSVGGFLIYPGAFGLDGVKMLAGVLTKSRLLGFAASFPLLWAAVVQRRMFYPSVMAALVFTGIELAALNMPIQAASAIPWSAVSMLSVIDAPPPYAVIGIVSICIVSCAGIIMAYVSFRKQDQ